MSKVFMAMEAKVLKTEDSITKLKEHLDKKTSPKTLKYSAWANIPADDEFKNHTVKAKAEQHFVEALRRYH